MADQARREVVLETLKKNFSKLLRSMQEKDAAKRPSVSFETDLINDLSIDSVETLDFLNSIEDEFNVSPDLHIANTKKTVGQIVDYIIELQDEK